MSFDWVNASLANGGPLGGNFSVERSRQQKYLFNDVIID